MTFRDLVWRSAVFKGEMNPNAKALRQAALALIVGGASLTAQAGVKVCVFDPLGKSGDVHRALEDYRLAMAKHGVEVELKTYVDELVAVEDFRAGQCDGTMATALRTRQFKIGRAHV